PTAYGGPPAMPGQSGGSGGGPRMPFGGPPAMPGGSGAGPAAPSDMPVGGPPGKPGGGVKGKPSIFGRGGPMGARQAPASVDPEKKVLVDLGLEYDPAKASSEVKQLKVDLDKANANYEREVADGKRIRAESATLRDRIEELRAAVKDREEQAA